MGDIVYDIARRREVTRRSDLRMGLVWIDYKSRIRARVDLLIESEDCLMYRFKTTFTIVVTTLMLGPAVLQAQFP